jgi:hypothetical protein
MKNEFVPYEQALELKELGFDEPCFGFYNYLGQLILMVQENENVIETYKNSYVKIGKQYAAPLYQQAFRWFRDKHNLYNTISKNGYMIEGETNGDFLRITKLSLKSYEEAELACLKKLIELVKSK